MAKPTPKERTVTDGGGRQRAPGESMAGLMTEHSDLISRAEQTLRLHRTRDGRIFGDVASAVLSERGGVYVGVCVDIPGWGLCAERSALAAMVTAGEYRFRSIVAVWCDEDEGRLHVLPPCGICREFMRALDEANLDAEVILGRTEAEPLRRLIPHHAWPAPLGLRDRTSSSRERDRGASHFRVGTGPARP